MKNNRVFVVMPCLNEAKQVLGAIESLLSDPSSRQCRFLLLDGGSSDGTCDLVRQSFGESVEIVHNPKRLQACAVNLAANIAYKSGAEYLIRADLHAIYPKYYLTGLIDTIEETQAASVVVPMRTLGGNWIQNAASDLYSTWLGNGGAAHRTGQHRGWVEHGHHAIFDLEWFLKVGGYDQDFTANEDAEFDVRLRSAGGRIFLENRLTVDYIPRSSLVGTLKQYFRNGKFRIWNSVKHKRRLGIRQLIPASVSPFMLFSVFLSLYSWWFMVFPIAYFASIIGISFASSRRGLNMRGAISIFTMSLLAAISHFGFSFGAMHGIAQLYFSDRDLRRQLQSRRHSDMREIGDAA